MRYVDFNWNICIKVCKIVNGTLTTSFIRRWQRPLGRSSSYSISSIESSSFACMQIGLMSKLFQSVAEQVKFQMKTNRRTGALRWPKYPKMNGTNTRHLSPESATRFPNNCNKPISSPCPIILHLNMETTSPLYHSIALFMLYQKSFETNSIGWSARPPVTKLAGVLHRWRWLPVWVWRRFAGERFVWSTRVEKIKCAVFQELSNGVIDMFSTKKLAMLSLMIDGSEILSTGHCYVNNLENVPCNERSRVPTSP